MTKTEQNSNFIKINMKQLYTNTNYSIKSTEKFFELTSIFAHDKNGSHVISQSQQKRVKLNYLLQNSKNSKTRILPGGKNSDKTVTKSMVPDLSKDLSLYLSIIEKPINLLFSIDQFLFEFSKKTYQQKKTGEFFQQLKERKKLSLFYGSLTRKQLVNLMDKAKKYKGYFSKNFFSLLERRLDVVLYRSGVTKTVAEARQLIKHKKILVNNNLINVPSLLLDPGDLLSMAPETANVLSSELLKSVKPKFNKNYPQIFGDFYSKFRKTLEKSSQLRNFEFLRTPQSFQSQLLCHVLIQLLCTRMKLRSYWNLKKNPNENTLLTMFKWKAFSCGNFQKNTFFAPSSIFVDVQKRTSSQNSFSSKKPPFSKFKGDQQDLLYASSGSLQKKPVFWGRNLLNYKQNKNLLFKNQKTLQLHEKNQRDQKNMKSPNLQKRNLTSFFLQKKKYRNSFLIFLKCLETSKKFSSLLPLNLKKSLFKRSFLKQKSLFSRTMTFRIIKPMHIEVSYNLLNIIYLYSPQRVNFPFYINLDLISRSLR